MDTILLHLTVASLQLTAIGTQSPDFYKILRALMPLLAALAAYNALQQGQLATWIVAFVLSGLPYLGTDRMPRFIWLPINLSFAALYLGYLGHLAWD